MTMVKSLGKAFVVVALMSVFSPTAWAQVQTGSILVRAVDQQGALVPGVTVTISSPVLVSGTQTGVTDAGGIYRFPSLPPGTYTVKVELSAFQTINREGVIVGAGSTAPLDFTMRVGGLNEAMTVTGESPVIDTTSANVNVHLDAKLLETTPAGRDIWSIVEYKVPGLIMTTPDVGGNQGGLQRGITARGTGNAQNTQTLNGVNVGDPAAIGFAGYYYDPSSFQDVQISSGANDITVPSGGVLINMVTKSGTNHFGGQVLDTYQGKGTQWDNIDADLQRLGVRPNGAAVDYIKNFNLNAGGPILKDRLFYFAALNDQRTAVHFAGFPSPVWTGAAEPDTTNITSVFTDPTYQINAKNRVQATVSRQVYDKVNRGADTSNGTQDPESVWHEHDVLAVYQGLWNTVLTDRQFVDTRVSYNSIDFPLNLKTDQQTLLDQATNIRTRANNVQQVMDRRRLQVSSNWQYYIPQALGGRHEIRAGFDNAYTPETVDIAINDDVRLVYRSAATSGGPAGPVQVQVFNTPLQQKRAVMQTSLYAQDSFIYKRFTLVGGLRWERVEGWLPAQTDPASAFFPEGTVLPGVGGTPYTVQRSFPEVRGVPRWHNIGPRGSFVYDLFGTGKTAAKASIARYYDTIGTGTPGTLNPNGLIQQNFTWTDNGDLLFQPGELGTSSAPSLPPTAAQLSTRFATSLKRP
ncbi:MAG TPA: TonB-dependent receptor, partial [Vicinamibacterales bacterium]